MKIEEMLEYTKSNLKTDEIESAIMLCKTEKGIMCSCCGSADEIIKIALFAQAKGVLEDVATKALKEIAESVMEDSSNDVS